MNTIELIINDSLINGIEEIKLTKSVNDLGDLPSRQGEFSVTLSAPLTNNNRLAFGLINSINVLDNFSKKLNTYFLYESGVLISSGSATIISVTSTIDFVLFASNSSWAETISSNNLRDLSLNDKDYSLIPSAVAARRNLTSEMSLPNVYYGGFQNPATPYNVFDFKPCFHIEYLIQKMFKTTGYTIVNQMKESDYEVYKKIVTIPSSEWVQVSYEGVSYKGTIAYSDNNGANWNANNLWIGGDKFYRGAQTIPFGYPIINKGSSTTTYEGIEIQTRIIRPKSISGYIEIDFNSAQPTPQSVSLTLIDFFSGNTLLTLGTIEVNSSGTKRIDFNFDISGFNFNPKQIDAFVKLVLPTFNTTGTGTYKIIGGEIIITDDGFSQLPQRVSNTYEFVGDVAGCLPDLEQSKLLLTIVNQFCLIISTDNITKKVFFIPLDNILDNLHIAKDWTNKVDLTEDYEISYDFFENYFQKNYFRYTNDEKDAYTAFKNIGDFYILNDNKNLPAIGDIYTSDFSALSREIISGKTLAVCPFYPSNDLKPKLGITKLTTENKITQFGMPLLAQSNEVFFDELDFEQLIDNNYKTLKNVFKNNLVIKLLLRLTRADFSNVDFSIPIFLDFMHDSYGNIRGHFYINEINQYPVGSGASCEVTLIQID